MTYLLESSQQAEATLGFSKGEDLRQRKMPKVGDKWES